LKIDRSTIANLVRLLELPLMVQQDLQSGVLSAGQARALLPLGDEAEQTDFCQRIRNEGLSVRDTERLVQEKIQVADAVGLRVPASRPTSRKPARSGHVASLEQRLRIALGTKIDIRTGNRGRGQIVIHFRGNDEFERLSSLLLEAGPDGLQRFAG
jgi:ParB family chromosome partitioning protein